MGMTPQQFFEAFVEPNRWDYHETPGDIRRAFNAAVSASHLADHYFTYYKKYDSEKVKLHENIGKFVEFLSIETEGAFRDIRSMSNAYKHLYNTNGPSAKYESINSCGSIERLELQEDSEIEEIEEGFIEVEDRESRLTVIFRRKDGTKGEFFPSLEKVLTYFQEKLYESS